jgi:hypothetical protein
MESLNSIKSSRNSKHKNIKKPIENTLDGKNAVNGLKSKSKEK